MVISKRLMTALGATAVAAHLLGGVADIFSGYAPEAGDSLGSILSLSFENIRPLFKEKSLEHARIGHFLAIFFIPFGLAGVVQVFLALNPSRNRGAVVFLVLGAPGVVYGTFYHGTLAFLVGALQLNTGTADSSLLTYFNSLSEPLGAVLIGFDLLLSALFVTIVLVRRTFFPKWMAAVNPLSIQLVWSLLILAAPHPVDQLLWLTVFNLSFAVWYALTTVTVDLGERDRSTDLKRALSLPWTKK